MNTARIKAYAPQARREFIQAVTDKAGLLGLSRDHIEPMEIKGDVAVIGGRALPKRTGELRDKLEERIRRQGFDQVMEAMAYTWFNRFVALRYMELHDYLEHGYRVLSNRSGSDIPEILEHAAEMDLAGLNKERIIELRLAGDKDNELYRMLLVAQCNALHKAMPFLFGRIDDLTELLLPDNLLYSQSPIRKLVQSIDEADWQEVEIIGWIYQFYISEKKDEVIGKLVNSEDIPAATQLFTPKWIVKYMVQNTLGRQWLATYPDSKLREKMEYYIEPAEQTEEVKAQLAAITPSELDPEAITLLDPACGSGHILVEAYDILKEIYLERGYRTKDIPRLILEKNLYGLEICDRAAQLACFALLMKARADDKRIVASDNSVQLNILAIQESKELDVDQFARVLLQERVIRIGSSMPQQQVFFQPRAMQPTLSKTEKPEVSREQLSLLLDLFKEAKTVGSLLVVPNELKEALPQFQALLAKAVHWDAQSRTMAAMILPLVRQTEFLSKKYSCAVTNPPYMGSNGLNPRFKVFAQENYPNSKSDLFAMFVERIIDLTFQEGFIGLMTPFTWMFLISYEKLRLRFLNECMITSLVRPEYHAFFDSAYVPICSFTLQTIPSFQYMGTFIDLNDFYGAQQQPIKTLEAISNKDCKWRFQVPQSEFQAIPGSPIAFSVSKKLRNVFRSGVSLGKIAEPRQGLATADNDRFLKLWHETPINRIGIGFPDKDVALRSGKHWFPYQKGGTFRKWYGNHEFVINWEKDGDAVRSFPRAVIRNPGYYFKEGMTWTSLTIASFNGRFNPPGFIFDSKGPVLFPKQNDLLLIIIGFMNSALVNTLLKIFAPTLDYNQGPVSKLPYLPAVEQYRHQLNEIVKSLIDFAKTDWDSYEISWDLSIYPLQRFDYLQLSLSEAYASIRTHWLEMTLEMQRLEEENNRIFIEAYDLQDELTPEVPLSEITLTCNPHYRYGGNKTEKELESLLLADTMKELISYALGCMMGRYSLDQPGLVYAHSENIGFDASKYSSFPADEDGIIPITDMDWFPDDATHRFVEFLKVAWPSETLEENLKFVAESLFSKRGETSVETIRRYLSTGFFKDHLKTYKRRPIYWLFSSGKNKAFECLVYLHRYNEATLSRMRGSYVTPLQGKLNARIEYLRNEVDRAGTSSARKKLAQELELLSKKQAELARFDEELRHFADQKITLDLDDGVKINYGKFGNLLAEKKAVTGE